MAVLAVAAVLLVVLQLQVKEIMVVLVPMDAVAAVVPAAEDHPQVVRMVQAVVQAQHLLTLVHQ
jgi:hypothetical protein